MMKCNRVALLNFKQNNIIIILNNSFSSEWRLWGCWALKQLVQLLCVRLSAESQRSSVRCARAQTVFEERLNAARYSTSGWRHGVSDHSSDDSPWPFSSLLTAQLSWNPDQGDAQKKKSRRYENRKTSEYLMHKKSRVETCKKTCGLGELATLNGHLSISVGSPIVQCCIHGVQW